MLKSDWLRKMRHFDIFIAYIYLVTNRVSVYSIVDKLYKENMDCIFYELIYPLVCFFNGRN